MTIIASPMLSCWALNDRPPTCAGTLIVKSFIEKIFADYPAKFIYIDPAVTNKRAIRCYEKAGFQFVKIANDGVTDCYIMKINNNTATEKSNA